MIIHIDGRVLGGPMSKAEAVEYVVEHSQVEISDEDELNPICSNCGTIEELAVQSSNIEGYLCPVCDDPTREIVE